MITRQSWYGHGKLLITGEYLVMEGAKALALPVKYGQFLSLKTSPVSEKPFLKWMARKPEGLWFQAGFSLPGLDIAKTDNEALAFHLRELLLATTRLNPDFLKGKNKYEVETLLEFEPEFGFGSSSTLISNLAYWAQVDPFELQFSALGGSAYDVACARAKGPVFYQLKEGKPRVENVTFDPPFSDYLFFVYLGQKQRTSESIKRFKQKAIYGNPEIQKISDITDKIIRVSELFDFEQCLQEHERLLSKILYQPTIKERFFASDPFQVKSLGAWGGDFVLMTAHMPVGEFKALMKKRGFSIVFSWDELVL